MENLLFDTGRQLLYYLGTIQPAHTPESLGTGKRDNEHDDIPHDPGNFETREVARQENFNGRRRSREQNVSNTRHVHFGEQKASSVLHTFFEPVGKF